LEAIREEHGADRLSQLFADLDAQLLKKYCAKPGLSEADPEYCIYARSGACGYMNILRTIYRDFGINVVRRQR
jgi:hypothetical protein